MFRFRSIFFFATSFLLLFLGNLCAKNYYVSSASSGSADASNWSNMQQIQSFFNTSHTWATGDTVFIHGGTDSVVYAPISIVGLRPASQVVITKSKETGHNGEVIIRQTTASSGDGYALMLQGCINVKVTGLTIEIAKSSADGTGYGWAVYLSYMWNQPLDDPCNVVIDNCHIKSNGWGSLMVLEGQTKDSITNNVLEIPYNTTSSEQDCIDIKWQPGGGYVITGNTIKIVGSVQQPDAHHPEVIQWFGGHDVINKNKNYETVIANNFISFQPLNPCFGPGIFLFSEVPGNRFLIYNNVFVLKAPTGSIAQKVITICPVLTGMGTDGQDAGYNISLRLYNNTLINGTPNGYGLWLEYIDTLIIKNNIFVNDNQGASPLNYSRGSLSHVTYLDIDNNQYYQQGTSNLTMYPDSDGTPSLNWTQWKALYNTNGTHIDAHGISSITTFENKYGLAVENYRLATGSSGINAGADFTGIIPSTDILGTTRGTSWDIGALETAVDINHFYYVANNGNDANSGTSTSSPWKTISKVNSISFNPGDNILFRRGDTWSEILTPQGSGNASKPITYDAYGSGNLPIIDGGTTRNNCISLIGVNYINIRNFRVQYAAVNTTGNIHVQNTDHLRIENCDIYITSHGGVNVESSTNPYIGDNTMSSPVSNNDNQADGIYSQRNSNGIYENNSIIISDMGAGHNDGIQSYLDADMTFRNNYIYQNNSLTLAQGIDMSDGAGTFYVYNNVVKCPNSTSNIIGFNNDVSGTGALRCYQNTVLGNVNCLRILKCTDVTVKNNIFYSNSATSIIDIGATLNSGSEIDYNLYNRSGSGSMVLYEPQGYMTYTQWKAAGYETHGLNSNPIVNDTLCPAINSPVVNAGTNLGGIYSYDKEGILRPVNGVDLGAYELKSAPVPVELTSFTGNFINNSILLNWSTATEINNQGFDIEKNDNSSWVKIGFVEGKGNSLTKNNYSFEDKNPVGYTIKYRLKQIDINSNFKYSDVIAITAIPKGFSIGNYPNPFNPSTKIRYSVTSESMINLVIYNIIGERIDVLKNEQQQPGTYEINWNGSGHPSGIYLLSIIESPINGSAKNSKTIKMNLIK